MSVSKFSQISRLFQWASQLALILNPLKTSVWTLWSGTGTAGSDSEKIASHKYRIFLYENCFNIKLYNRKFWYAIIIHCKSRLTINKLYRIIEINNWFVWILKSNISFTYTKRGNQCQKYAHLIALQTRYLECSQQIFELRRNLKN